MRTRNGAELDMSKYFTRLTDRVFKILPLKEEENEGLNTYIKSLVCELTGGKTLIVELYSDDDYISLILGLECIGNMEDTKEVRRKVFECINLCKKIQDKYN